MWLIVTTCHINSIAWLIMVISHANFFRWLVAVIFDAISFASQINFFSQKLKKKKHNRNGSGSGVRCGIARGSVGPRRSEGGSGSCQRYRGWTATGGLVGRWAKTGRTRAGGWGGHGGRGCLGTGVVGCREVPVAAGRRTATAGRWRAAGRRYPCEGRGSAGGADA